MFNKKIVIIAVSAVLVLSLAGVGIYGAVTNGKDDAATTLAPDVTEPEDVSSDTEVTSSVQTQTTAPATTQPELAKLILGKWTDSAQMSGYHFYSDGSVEVTYVNLTVPIINIPVNGTAKGVYTLEGDRLTTKFSIYTATIEDKFTVKIENNMLSLYDLDDFETATYTRATDASDMTAAVVTTEPSISETQSVIVDGTEFIGSWINSDGTIGYVFNGDGTAKIIYSGIEYSGIYMTDEDTITIQYTTSQSKVTEEYTYTASKNNLSLVSEDDTTLFVRKGTANSPVQTNSLIGKWSDGANMSGYEFKQGGVVVITYVNFTVPVVNMPINGSYTGAYTINGDKVTLSYSIYGNSINEEYTYTVKDNVLTFVDSDGEVSTYLKK